MRLAEMNLDVSDERRIEVVANDLLLWHGPQLVLDATLVSPVIRVGAKAQPRAVQQAAARRKRRDTYPELDGARRCRLVVVGVEVGGRFGREAAQPIAPAIGALAS